MVTAAGERVPLSAIVSDADSVRTHRELLKGEPEARAFARRRHEPACSGVVLYLGLDRPAREGAPSPAKRGRAGEGASHHARQEDRVRA